MRNTAQCRDLYGYVWIIGTLNFTTDALLVAIPLPLVAKLQVGAMKKFLLCLLFGSGILVMIAVVLRIHFTLGGDFVNHAFWCMIGEYRS